MLLSHHTVEREDRQSTTGALIVTANISRRHTLGLPLAIAASAYASRSTGTAGDTSHSKEEVAAPPTRFFPSRNRADYTTGTRNRQSLEASPEQMESSTPQHLVAMTFYRFALHKTTKIIGGAGAKKPPTTASTTSNERFKKRVTSTAAKLDSCGSLATPEDQSSSLKISSLITPTV